MPSFLGTPGWLTGPRRHAEVVVPYGCNASGTQHTGRCGHRPLRKAQSATQASRRAAKRPRPRPRGMGGNRRKNHPQRGPPPRPPRQRLAKRKARKEQLVKFDFCPMTSECSTAQKVRKSDKGPARALVGAALTEQNSLEPRPAARQGASRARNCAATSVFSFDSSTAVFFLPPQKKWGWHPRRGCPATTPRSGQLTTAGCA